MSVRVEHIGMQHAIKHVDRPELGRRWLVEGPQLIDDGLGGLVEAITTAGFRCHEAARAYAERCSQCWAWKVELSGWRSMREISPTDRRSQWNRDGF